MCCPLVFEFSVSIGVFVIGLGQISFFFSLCIYYCVFDTFYALYGSVTLFYKSHLA